MRDKQRIEFIQRIDDVHLSCTRIFELSDANEWGEVERELKRAEAALAKARVLFDSEKLKGVMR